MKVTAIGFLHWHSGVFTMYRHDMSSCGPGYVAIRRIEIEVEIPDDFDPRPHQIGALRDAKSKVLAEAQIKANNIEEQIQHLLAIENKMEPA